MTGMGQYERPQSLARALELAKAGFRPLAGGTDLFPATTDRELSGPLLDLTAVAELCAITLDRQGLRIGGAVNWTAIARADMPPALAALQQAARDVGGRQIQNAGTIGGNLCNASPAADGVPPLLVLEAEVELAGPDGVRRMALSDFLTGPRRTALASGEILSAVCIARDALMGRSVFCKLGARRFLVISIASVAVRIVEREGRIARACVAVGSCSPVARRLSAVEAALDGQVLQDAAGRVTDAMVAAGLEPITDVRASADYRAAAAAELVRRAIAGLGGGADG